METDAHLLHRSGRSGVPGRAGLVALGLALWTTVFGLAGVMGETVPPNPGRGLNSATPITTSGDDELIIEEVFQSHLPTTLSKYRLRFSIHPHLGDWEKKDHLRLTTGLRYGLTEHCEISARCNLYFSHGNGDVRAFDDYGVANLRLGAKFNLGQLLFRGWETGVGVYYEFPLGEPPAELTDGLRHLRPYITFSHRLESRPDVRIFVGLRGDVVAQTSLPGTFGKNAFQSSSTGITGGWVIDRNNWHYTLEASYDTTRLLGDSDDSGEDLYSIRPGVIWEIPTRRNRQIMSRWVVGVALKHTWGPGGNSLGVSLKARYSRDIKNRPKRAPVIPDP